MSQINKILIITEGLEKAFMEAFVDERLASYKNKFAFKYIESRGKTKLNTVKKIIEEYQPSEGGSTLVIFDAEEDIHRTRQSLEAQKKSLGVEYAIFLLPNDKTEKGNFESLLREIVPEANVPFFDCWDNYKDCVKSLPKAQNVPDQKTEIYAYCALFLSDEEKPKAQLKNRDYRDSKLWDLNHLYLDSLYHFFDQILKNL